jgi:hypothetical protein
MPWDYADVWEDGLRSLVYLERLLLRSSHFLRKGASEDDFLVRTWLINPPPGLKEIVIWTKAPMNYSYTVHGSGLAPMALGSGRPDHLRAKGRARGCVALALFGRAKGRHRWPVARRVGPWSTRPGPQLSIQLSNKHSTRLLSICSTVRASAAPTVQSVHVVK